MLLKRFHPDVLLGSGHENEAGELAKVLTAILDLEVGEAIPKEFRDKSLTVVFVDEDGRCLRSKSPLLIAALQEEFLSDLEYIVINKKMPVNNRDKEETGATQANQAKSAKPESPGESNSWQSRDKTSSTDETKERSIQSITTLAEAKALNEYFNNAYTMGVLSAVDLSRLETGIKEKVNTLMQEKFKQTRITTLAEAKALNEYFNNAYTMGVLSAVDLSRLETGIKERTKNI